MFQQNSVTGSYTVKAFEKKLQTMFNVAYGALIEKMSKDKKKLKLLLN
jgi:hypothetical protein